MFVMYEHKFDNDFAALEYLRELGLRETKIAWKLIRGTHTLSDLNTMLFLEGHGFRFHIIEGDTNKLN